MADKTLDNSNVKEEVEREYPTHHDKVYECLKEAETKRWSIEKILECIKNETDTTLSDSQITQIKQWISMG